MSDVVILDSGPVGSLSNPNASTLAVAIRQWLADLIAAGRRVVLPEIADYEVRREFVRASMTQSLVLLDSLAAQIEYLPLSTPIMRLAADIWANARNSGQQTAPDHGLDGDAILAAQALSIGVPAVVATGNPAHLSRYLTADLWQNIVP